MIRQVASRRPNAVRWAVFYLWISASLVALLAANTWLRLLPVPNDAFQTTVNLIASVVLALTGMELWAGRSWARWLLATVFGGSFLFIVFLLFVPQAFGRLPTLLKLHGIAQFGLQAMALALAYHRKSEWWFGERSADREQQRKTLRATPPRPG